MIDQLFAVQSPTEPSIHARLIRLYAQCDVERGACGALAPNASVDACLRRLVSIARAEFHAVIDVHAVIDEATRFALTRAVRDRIAPDPALRHRAEEIRAIAALAEAELEYHYSAILSAKLREAERETPNGRPRAAFSPQAIDTAAVGAARDGFPTPGMDAAWSGSARDGFAAHGIGTSASASRRTGLHAGVRALEREPASDRFQALRHALAPFPYIESYVQLIRAELRLLQASPAPLFLRDRAVSRLSVIERRELRALQLQTEAFLAARGAWPACLARLPPQSRGPEPWGDRTIAVCGCGPLPISGLLLHAATGAELVLIDESARALDAARELVDALAGAGLLERSAMQFRLSDAAALRYGRGLPPHPDNVPCDALLVASLIAQAVKLRLAQSLRAVAPSTALALIVRSAGGLCADLIYERVPTEQLGQLPLVFCGESVPRHQVFESLPAATAARCESSALGSRELLVIADPQVLNSSELYYRMPRLQMAEAPLARPWSARYLERVRQMLRE